MSWAVEAGPLEFNGDGTTDPFTISFGSGAGADRLLVVVVTCYRDAGSTVVGVTYDSVSMVQDAVVNVNSGQQQQIFSLVAPATGSRTLAIDLDLGGPYPSFCASVICFTGIEQTPTINDSGIASGFNNYLPITLDPTEVGDLCIFGGSSGNQVTWTPDGGDTEFADDAYPDDGGDASQGASYRLADGVTENGGVTGSSSANMQGIAIAYKAAAGGPAEPHPDFTRLRRNRHLHR